MIHIISGDSAAEVLRRSGLDGEVIGWRDSPAVGPSPGGLTREEYRELRAKFRGVPVEDFQDLDNLEAARGGEEIVFWFDACPYDQVMMIRLLDWVSDRSPAPRSVEMIAIGAHAETPRFHGLGELSPAQMRGLWSERRTVDGAQVESAREAWRFFCSSDPRDHVLMLEEDWEPLPFLHRALKRVIAEYPSVKGGLGGTETRILKAIETGVLDFGACFRAVDEMETVNHGCWYGDGGLWEAAEGLASGAEPLLTIVRTAGTAGEIDRRARLAITFKGRETLAGVWDWARHGMGDRWVGGVRLRDCDSAWRWDDAGQALIMAP